MSDCRVVTFSAMTSGPNVRGETGSTCLPTSRPYRATPLLVTRPSIAETSSTRPDQFSGVSVHSMPASCGSAMLTKRRLLSAVRRPLRSRRSEEHTSELQSHVNLVCRLLLEKKKLDEYDYHALIIDERWKND